MYGVSGMVSINHINRIRVSALSRNVKNQVNEDEQQASQQQSARHTPKKKKTSTKKVPVSAYKANFMPLSQPGRARQSTPQANEGVGSAAPIVGATSSQVNKLVFNSGASAEFTTAIKDIVKGMPASLVDFLIKNKVKIQVVHDLADFTIPGFGAAAGVFYPDQNIIKMPEFIDAEETQKNDIETNVTVAHEIGHAIDWNVGLSNKFGKYFTMVNKDIAAAYKKDLNNLEETIPSASDRSKLDYITTINASRKEETARLEAFAEVYASLLIKEDFSTKSLLKTGFPNLTKVIEKLFNDVSKFPKPKTSSKKKKEPPRLTTEEKRKILNSYVNGNSLEIRQTVSTYNTGNSTSIRNRLQQFITGNF